MTADKDSLQFLVAMIVVGLWAIGVVVAVFDGSTMLKATTPLMTLIFGWLFAAKVTS